MSYDYIPIDFLKAEVIGLNIDVFKQNPCLKPICSKHDDDVLLWTKYKYLNIRIKIYENGNRIEFAGSLHTLYNKGQHNHNDFTIEAFKIALKLLYEKLLIKPENLRIMQLEWGYNLVIYFAIKNLLDGAIQHKGINKTVKMDDPKEGEYLQFKHQNYTLKLYNKALHFKLENKQIFRFEIKQTNWSKYRSSGIKTLLDFINCDKSIFFDELVKQFEQIILFDIKPEYTKYDKYSKKLFWEQLRQSKSNKTFKYHRDKLKSLNRKFGLNYQNTIIKLLIKKGNELQL